MTDAEGDSFAVLTTAPIFDDRLYFAEALLLQDGETDELVDSRLTVAAKESGIEDPDLFLIPRPVLLDISTALSTMSLRSDQRSSISVHSRETQSTTFTSLPSRSSRDKSPMSRMPPPLVRASFSVDRNDAIPESPPSSMRHRHSTSGFPTSLSLQSSASSVQGQSARKHKRASALFSMFRKEQSACPSRSHHSHHFKPQSPKLGCGHSLSKYAIRVHVQEALERKDGAAPSCCGQPMPREVLSIVLTSAEIDVVADNNLPSPDAASLRDSGYSENGLSNVDLAHALFTDVLVSEPSTIPATPTYEPSEADEARLSSALESETFQKLLAEQKEQFRRVSAFESHQRTALSANHQHRLKRLKAQLETSKIEKVKQHVQQLERLDEFQLMMEHDLRNAQAMETQNVATALKYIEAYCLGPNPAHEGVIYAVTDEDRRKLERQRMIQEKLPAKHESAINVLRGKQERDTGVRIQKQQMELDQLHADYEKEKSAQELQYAKDSSQLETIIQTRRSKITRRWDLKFEIWRKNWENENESKLYGTLQHGTWPEATDTDLHIDPSSSLAIYIQSIA
ncbi:hypothetical protein P171DRAFT_435081 [Karstenula rhodostoma CBS 690.94]|uniref:Uncharacterized protein n=1 Tax=Karstenula rhodostoma CBS 690.94 TaxID=1392251 RepID=A0A9P4PA16_9PLEO|nr:hypothetical protein P171DRAFT_435081 [Karstenula rhodostoma CBS 690.94]